MPPLNPLFLTWKLNLLERRKFSHSHGTSEASGRWERNCGRVGSSESKHGPNTIRETVLKLQLLLEKYVCKYMWMLHTYYLIYVDTFVLHTENEETIDNPALFVQICLPLYVYIKSISIQSMQSKHVLCQTNASAVNSVLCFISICGAVEN